ncbi:DUF5819 family protein [Streptomyces somaliensis DSM 40738]|uniref:Uncharacterized protein n=1 Tax=Streptomyces somaliensis (strain ATCC 33201 / DSM 40738 / JCM 12659 / KCTC 9044 / NCTC 11332 / NRRL B-12077 / IP 733) TaxID=1134445 RepID=A0AA44IBP8_STRE0|nr:DUF5819 family protein [Streptomyces somaliensis]MCQ0024778.1 DUF5819 family protein [Streptomyces somaliensis DSM 40738]NKY12909.1 hypothetical protein [Streptomyces somaliensis DSM 40738]
MESYDERRGRAGGAAGGESPGRTGLAALSLPYQVVGAVALAVVGLVACFHVGMVFLHVAPSNTLSKRYGETVDEWVMPEFEQNWKLFAPNPLQQNVAVQVRAEVARDGTREVTPWIDLTAGDAAAIRGNPFPSHTQQNELRRAWDFYANQHDGDRVDALRAGLSERYVRRIALMRLEDHRLGGRIERIQVRSSTTSVAAPPWSRERTDTRPYHRVQPWWTVTAADLPGGVTGGRTVEGAR